MNTKRAKQYASSKKDVPLKLRDAAITQNPSLVAGKKRYYDLIRESGSEELS